MLEPDRLIQAIRDLLKAKALQSLGTQDGDKALCPRAGVILFHEAGDDRHFYLMLPKQKVNKATPPDYQIAKGGRTVQRADGSMLDVREVSDLGKGAPLDPAVDALREAVEEQGLRLSNIKSLCELGVVKFVSVSKGTPEPMWLIAAELGDMRAFDVPTDPKTENCRWFAFNALKSACEKTMSASVDVDGCSVRTDHIKILIDFVARLVRHKQS